MPSREPVTLDLFEAAQAEERKELQFPLPFPGQKRFPINIGAHRVEHPVEDDLADSIDPLIVTGYAALDRVIVFCGRAQPSPLRILFGHEPYALTGRQYRLDGASFPEEVEAFWLEQNISLLHSAALVRTIQLLESGSVQARFVHGGVRLHAKIYCGDAAASLGSSNFTHPGMESQHEANARFEKGKDGKRFEETRALAENYWAIGRDYNAELIALLRKLLQFVTWQEALARACSELLEGEWAEPYLNDEYMSEADTLWPSQKQGIAQALAVLSQHDSVLIADATGAGKTRMGTYLIGAIRDDIVRRSRVRNRANTVMICPPSVLASWEAEKTRAQVSMEVYSQGGLSNKASKGHEIKTEALKRAQILCVDEGHNFLNLGTQRTQLLLRNMADHVVVLTATPINRGVVDLLRIADVLGADNLQESTLKAFEKMLGASKLSRSLAEAEIEQIRAEIRKFTVRRTKAMLNTLIAREPEAYTDRHGRRCQFPKHRARVYQLSEPQKDRDLAARIRSLAQQLRGVTHFEKPLELPEELRKQGVSEFQYLEGRLQGATKLVQYLIAAALRSSRAALIEHIEGSKAAIEAFEIGAYQRNKSGGNMIARLQKMAGTPPDNRLSVEVPIPEWLTDEEAHRNACMQDIAVYREIAECCRSMSNQRESHKAARLIALQKRHDMILAFDSRPITLAVICDQLARSKRVNILMGWGGDDSARKKMIDSFAPDSTATGIIGLCSDSLSEGVNLQRASALMHLDMPSVVRIAEQRAGRVDRLDTAHKQIEVWWPDDGAEFQLTSDEKFVQRFETVESLLGSNMPLPAHLQSTSNAVSAQQMIKEYEQSAEMPWDGLDDAFSPVRALVEGEQALIDDEVYQRYRRVTARVLARVSLVKSKTPWAFFCLTAGNFDAPRWLFLPGYTAPILHGMDQVALGLRQNLSGDVENLNDPEKGAEELRRFIKRLVTLERRLLSQKKQRALDEMEYCLKRLSQEAAEQRREKEASVLETLLRTLRSPDPERQPDWDALATRWLDLIRPVWFEKLAHSRRKRPLLLKDLRKDLLSDPARLTEQVLTRFQKIELQPPIDRRVRACIVGVP